jgi:Leucine-rich repeat (LRR) protein
MTLSRRCRQLVILDLSNNRLEEIPSAAIAMLSSLRRLSLAGNRIVELSWGTEVHLSNLKFLDASDNRICECFGAFFG